MSRLEEDNLTKKLKHNGFWLYVFAFLIAPSGYLLKLMIASELSVDDIGLFYSILGLISLISIYNDLGLTEALQYFLPKYLLKKEIEKARSLVWFTRGMQFLTGILIGGLLYFGAPWLAKHYFESTLALPLLRLFCLYFLVINLYQVLNSLFFATQQVKWARFIESIKMRSIVIMTFLAIFVFDIFSVFRFAGRWLFGLFIGVFIACIGVVKLFPWIYQGTLLTLKNHMAIEERTRYGLRVMLGASAGSLYGQVNQQLVLVFLGTAAAGIWAYYLAFFSISNILIGPIIGYLFPLLNELREKDNKEKIRQLYIYILWGIIGFGIVGGLLAYYLSPWLSVLLFGEQFREAGTLFQSFAPWIFTSPLIGIVFADIASRGWVKQRVAVLFFGLVISIVASYILITVYGLIGSVYGQIIGTFGLLLGVGLVYWRNILIRKQ